MSYGRRKKAKFEPEKIHGMLPEHQPDKNMPFEIALSNGSKADISFKYGHNKYGRNPLKNVTLLVPTIPHVQFSICKEGGLERSMKSLNLSVEHQTNDEKFDHQFYIACEDTALSHILLQSEKSRKTIKHIFDHHATNLTIDNGFLSVSFPPESLGLNSKSDYLTPNAQNLCRDIILELEDWLAKYVPSNWAAKKDDASFFFKYLTRPLVTTLNITFFLGLICYFIIFDSADSLQGEPIIMTSLPYWLSTSVLTFALCALFFKKDSLSHSKILITGTAASLLLSCLMTNYLLIRNETTDQSAVQSFSTHIVRLRHYNNSRRPDTFYAVLNKWVDGQNRFEYKISRQQYNSLKNYDQIHIFYKNGAHGVRWATDIQWERVLTTR